MSQTTSYDVTNEIGKLVRVLQMNDTLTELDETKNKANNTELFEKFCDALDTLGFTMKDLMEMLYNRLDEDDVKDYIQKANGDEESDGEDFHE